MVKEYVVLYTHQKTKKAKTWQDGILKCSETGTKATLYDSNQMRLDVVHIRQNQVEVGEQLESDRYLILVDEEHVSVPSHTSGVLQNLTVHPCKSVEQQGNFEDCKTLQGNRPPTRLKLPPRIGLKRKKTGFVPPRQIKESKVSKPEEPITALAAFQKKRNDLLHPKEILPQNIPDLFSLYKSNPNPSANDSNQYINSEAQSSSSVPLLNSPRDKIVSSTHNVGSTNKRRGTSGPAFTQAVGVDRLEGSFGESGTSASLGGQMSDLVANSRSAVPETGAGVCSLRQDGSADNQSERRSLSKILALISQKKMRKMGEEQDQEKLLSVTSDPNKIQCRDVLDRSLNVAVSDNDQGEESFKDNNRVSGSQLKSAFGKPPTCIFASINPDNRCRDADLVVPLVANKGVSSVTQDLSLLEDEDDAITSMLNQAKASPVVAPPQVTGRSGDIDISGPRTEENPMYTNKGETGYDGGARECLHDCISRKYGNDSTVLANKEIPENNGNPATSESDNMKEDQHYDRDSEASACFDINFSPLSYITESETESDSLCGTAVSQDKDHPVAFSVEKVIKVKTSKPEENGTVIDNREDCKSVTSRELVTCSPNHFAATSDGHDQNDLPEVNLMQNSFKCSSPNQMDFSNVPNIEDITINTPTVSQVENVIDVGDMQMHGSDAGNTSQKNLSCFNHSSRQLADTLKSKLDGTNREGRCGSVDKEMEKQEEPDCLEVDNHCMREELKDTGCSSQHICTSLELPIVQNCSHSNIDEQYQSETKVISEMIACDSPQSASSATSSSISVSQTRHQEKTACYTTEPKSLGLSDLQFSPDFSEETNHSSMAENGNILHSFNGSSQLAVGKNFPNGMKEASLTIAGQETQGGRLNDSPELNMLKKENNVNPSIQSEEQVKLDEYDKSNENPGHEISTNVTTEHLNECVVPSPRGSAEESGSPKSSSRERLSKADCRHDIVSSLWEASGPKKLSVETNTNITKQPLKMVTVYQRHHLQADSIWADAGREDGGGRQLTPPKVTLDQIRTALSSTLPHPQELTTRSVVRTFKQTPVQQTDHIVAAAQEKLVDYAIKGSRTGRAARRQGSSNPGATDIYPNGQDACLLGSDTFNDEPSSLAVRPGFTEEMMRTSPAQAMHDSPEYQYKGQEDALSLYGAAPEGCIFDHDKQFLATPIKPPHPQPPKFILQVVDSKVDSPGQCVPSPVSRPAWQAASPHVSVLDPNEQMVPGGQTVLDVHQKNRQRKPLLSLPYQDMESTDPSRKESMNKSPEVLRSCVNNINIANFIDSREDKVEINENTSPDLTKPDISDLQNEMVDSHEIGKKKVQVWMMTSPDNLDLSLSLTPYHPQISFSGRESERQIRHLERENQNFFRANPWENVLSHMPGPLTNPSQSYVEDWVSKNLSDTRQDSQDINELRDPQDCTANRQEGNNGSKWRLFQEASQEESGGQVQGKYFRGRFDQEVCKGGKDTQKQSHGEPLDINQSGNYGKTCHSYEMHTCEMKMNDCSQDASTVNLYGADSHAKNQASDSSLPNLHKQDFRQNMISRNRWCQNSSKNRAVLQSYEETSRDRDNTTEFSPCLISQSTEASLQDSPLSGKTPKNHNINTANDTPIQCPKPVRSINRGFRPPRQSKSCQQVGLPYRNNLRSSVSGQTTTDISIERDLSGELMFPSQTEVASSVVPERRAEIPVVFPDATTYRNTFVAAINEHLNIQLFELAKNYHAALARVDVTNYQPEYRHPGLQDRTKCATSSNPLCEHKLPSKMVQVKKDGPNKGRFFYACNAPRNEQCKFFKWTDDMKGSGKIQSTGHSRLQLSDRDSINTFFKGQGLPLYCHCMFQQKEDIYTQNKQHKLYWARKHMMQKNDHDDGSCGKKKLYLQLSRKEFSGFYTKDDLWVISQQLTFDPDCTILARSMFYGPSSSSEVEIEPLSSYSPSKWPNNVVCHALHAGNVSTELACINNLKQHTNPSQLPVLPYLLQGERCSNSRGRTFNMPSKAHNASFCVSDGEKNNLVEEFIRNHHLNDDQADALRNVAAMFDKEDNATPVALIHGVFGAGKSYLLAVIVLFLCALFDLNDSYTPGVPPHNKILISSITNVAVDRVLAGLLNLGFEDFVRVGSIKKIAKPVLPYSVHASGTDNQELKDLQEMLKSDLTQSERQSVKKSIEKHRKGENKKVVLLDECSQMTEPASLLPLSRFRTERLVLVGDPKQLDPTIQGSEPAHHHGLEQTLFDRLQKMGIPSVMLRTQYRCHPIISQLANTLFYSGQLKNGVTEQQRSPLVEGLPTLCFVDVKNGQECCGAGSSYSNEAEAQLVVRLLQYLLLQGIEPQHIGVITLYKAQHHKISSILLNPSLHGTHDGIKGVQISTVDAFQGGERAVILLSCVRTHSVGFIDCDKRTNVALTRAKHHLLILGHHRNLSSNKLWGQVISHCQAQPNGVVDAREFEEILEARMDNLLEADDCDSELRKQKQQRDSKRKKAPAKEEDPDALITIRESSDSVFEVGMPCNFSMENQGVNTCISPSSNEDGEESSERKDGAVSLSDISNLRSKKRRKIDPGLLDSCLDVDSRCTSSASDDGDLPEFTL